MNFRIKSPNRQDVIVAAVAIAIAVTSGLVIYQNPQTDDSVLAAVLRGRPVGKPAATVPTSPAKTSKNTKTATSAADSGALNLGINLDGPAYWSPLGSHCDATTAFSPWMEPNTTDYGSTGLYVTDPSKLTQDNYPLKNADSITLLLGYNSGTFNVSFDGSGELIIQGQKNWSKSGNRSTGTVNLQNGNLSLIQIRNVDTSNPIRNLKIVPANEPECVAGNTYRNLFLTKLAPFRTLRFMDWMSTNESRLVNWSDRSTKNSFGHMSARLGQGNLGVAYEDLIELANITGKDIWVNVPAHASDDFIRQFARLLKNNLNTNSKVYVEYSNEVWNSIFEQHAYARSMGRTNAPGDLKTKSDTEVAAYYYGMQTKKMADIFKSEYGASAFEQRIYPVLGSNIVAAYWPYWAFDAIKALYPNESGVTTGSVHNIRAIAVNPYLGSDQLDQVSGNDIFEKLKKIVTEKNAVWLASMKNVNKGAGYNLPYVIYESGQHLVGKSYNGVNYHEALNDPRMADVYKTLYTWWNNENPGQPAVHFAFISKQGPDADYHWGLFENMNQTTSVRYKALLDLAGGSTGPVTPPPPPPIPPVVCSTNYVPVCGSDGNSYTNDCNATKANTSVAYKGLCQSPRMGDLEALTANYNKTNCSTANNWCSGADTNKDAVSDFKDLVVISQNFNRKDCNEGNNWCLGADINKDGIVSYYAPGAAIAKGDFNSDGAIDAADFDIFIKALGTAEGETNYNAVTDMTSDKIVDRKDFIKFMINFRGENYSDADEDGEQSKADLDFVTSRIGARQGESKYHPRADINKDKVIDATDVNLFSILLNIKPTDPVTGLTPGLQATFYAHPTSRAASVAVIGTTAVSTVSYWVDTNIHHYSGFSEFPLVPTTYKNNGFNIKLEGKLTPKKDISGNPILGGDKYQLCVAFSGLLRLKFNGQQVFNYWPSDDYFGYPPFAECKPIALTENKPYDISLDFGKGAKLKLYWRINGIDTAMNENLFH
jgi:hypothetical protein